MSILDDDEKKLNDTQVELEIDGKNRRMARLYALLERLFGYNYREENPNMYQM